MRIAVVGAGISGLAAAWLLSRRHQVVLFEREGRLGGHTHTHDVEQAGRRYAVDSGFIVYNPERYPLLTRLFAELGVASQPTTMSFAVHDRESGLEYSASSLDALFCQRQNLISPRFWRMLRDILRFYREAPALLDAAGPGPTLAEYLAAGGYSKVFAEQHLVPMASALWSAPAAGVADFPAKYLVRFMANHHMLQLRRGPRWRVVKGGSHRYVEAMQGSWRAEVRRGSPASAIRRQDGGVVVHTAAGSEIYDHAVLACHSDEALRLLSDASAAEREILGAIGYQANDAVLHTDARVLPRARKAWAAWNAHVAPRPGPACTVSYCMSLLQSLSAPEPFVVTLNPSDAIDPDKTLRTMRYHHPIYTHAAVAAQARRAEINGRSRVWFCGAYWGFGFHEDGLRSAVEVAARLGVPW